MLGLNGVVGNKMSASCPPDVPKVKSEPPTGSDPQVVALIDKDRQKKDNHNMSKSLINLYSLNEFLIRF